MGLGGREGSERVDGSGFLIPRNQAACHLEWQYTLRCIICYEFLISNLPLPLTFSTCAWGYFRAVGDWVGLGGGGLVSLRYTKLRIQLGSLHILAHFPTIHASPLLEDS